MSHVLQCTQFSWWMRSCFFPGFSGTQHEVDQPSHLVVADRELCATVCAQEYGNPCESFCPAAVYEMIPDDARAGKQKLVIHH